MDQTNNQTTEYQPPQLSKAQRLKLIKELQARMGAIESQLPGVGEYMERPIGTWEDVKAADEYPFIADVKSKENDWLQADMQPWSDVLANGLLRVAVPVITKALASPGYVAGVIPAILTGSFEPIVNNFWVNMWDNAEEGFKEMVPIYKRKQYETGDILSQLGSREFWAEDGADGLAFMLSAFAGAGYTKLLQFPKIGKMIGNVAKAESQFAKNKVIQAIAKKTAKHWDNVTITTWNTISEAGWEAKDIGKVLDAKYEEILSSYKENLTSKMEEELKENNLMIPPKVDLEDPQSIIDFETFQNKKQNIVKKYEDSIKAKEQYLKDKKGEALFGTFVMNLVALTFSNYWETTALFGKGRGREALLKEIVAETGGDLGKKAVSHKARKMAKYMGQGIVAEGLWEENIQASIQKYEEMRGLDETDQPRVMSVFNGMIDNILLKNDDATKAMVLGGALGILGGAVKGFREGRSEKKDKDFLLNIIKKRNLEYPNELKKFAKTKIVEKDGKKAEEFETDENGNIQYDLEAAVESASIPILKTKFIQQYISAARQGDQVAMDRIKFALMAQHAYMYLSQDYGYETLQALIDHRKQEGINNEDHDLLSDLAREEDWLRELKRQYDIVNDESKTLDKLDESPEALAFTNAVKATLYGYAVDAAAYEYSKKQLHYTKAGTDANPIYERNGQPISKKKAESLDKAQEELENHINSIKQERVDLKDRFKELYEYQKSKKEAKEKSAKRINELDKIKKEKGSLTEVEQNEYDELKYAEEEDLGVNGFVRGNLPMDLIRGLELSEQNNQRFGIKQFHQLKKGKEALIDFKVEDLIEKGADPFDVVMQLNQKTYLNDDDMLLMEEKTNELKNRVELKTNKEKQYETEGNQLKKEAVNKGYGDLVDEYSMTNNISAIAEQLDDDQKIETFSEIDEKTQAEKKAKIEKEEAQRNLDYAVKLLASNSMFKKEVDKRTQEDEDAINKDGDKFFQKQFARTKFSKAQTLIDEYNKKKEEDKLNDFSQPVKIGRTIAELEKLKKILSKREGFEDVITEIDNMLKMLNEALAISHKNQQNHEIKQVEIMQNEKSLRMNSLGVNETGAVNDQVVYDLIGKIIGNQLLDEIVEESSKDEDGNIIFPDVIIQLIKNSEDNELKEQLIDLLKAKRNALLPQIDKVDYSKNPAMELSEFLRMFLQKKRGNVNDKSNPALEENSIIKIAQVEYDVKDVEEAVDKDSTIPDNLKDEVKEILYDHKKIVAIDSVIEMLQSDTNIKSVVEDELHLYSLINDAQKNNRRTIAPSMEQIIALKKLVDFYHSNKGNKFFDDIAFFKGGFGVGKTTLMRMLKALLRLKKNEIVAFGIDKGTSDNVARILDTNTSSIKEFLERTNFDGIKLIVVDEAASAMLPDIRSIALKLQEINKGKTNKIKMVMLGDPTQITKDLISVMKNPKSLKMNDNDKTLYAYNATIIPSLKTVFRTNVGAILQVVLSFHQAYKRVKDVIFTSNAYDFDNLPDKIIGAQTGSTEDLKKVLRHNIAKQPGRTKLIAVTSEEHMKKYDEFKDTPNVTILPYTELLGSTYDEVYIDIMPHDKQWKVFKTKDSADEFSLDFNGAIKQAGGRTSQYLFVTSFENSFENRMEADLESNLESRSEMIENMVQSYSNFVAEEKRVVEKYLGKVKTKEPKKAEEEIPKKEETDDIQSKIDEIEKRRKKELDKINQRIEKLNKQDDSKIRVKLEIYRTLDVNENPVEVEITTNKDGSRILKARQINEDGSVEPMAYAIEGINNKAQAILTNEQLIEGYIGNENNTLKRINVDENPNQTYIDKINAKYDAEIEALKQNKLKEEDIFEEEVEEVTPEETGFQSNIPQSLLNHYKLKRPVNQQEEDDTLKLIEQKREEARKAKEETKKKKAEDKQLSLFEEAGINEPPSFGQEEEIKEEKQNTEPEEIEQETAEPEESVKDISSPVVPQVGQFVEEKDGTYHSLQYPTENNLNPNKKENNYDKIPIGSEVIYVREYFERDSEYFIKVYGKQENGQWLEIGIVSKEELKTSFGQQLSDKLKQSNTIVTYSSATGELTFPEDAIIAKGTLQDKSFLGVSYSPKTQAKTNIAQDIFNKFLSLFDSNKNLRERVIKNAQTSGKVGYYYIYSDKEAEAFYKKWQHFQPKSGIPYLVLQMPNQGNKPILTTLSPRTLKNTDREVVDSIDFVNNIFKIDEILKQRKFKYGYDTREGKMIIRAFRPAIVIAKQKEFFEYEKYPEVLTRDITYEEWLNEAKKLGLTQTISLETFNAIKPYAIAAAKDYFGIAVEFKEVTFKEFKSKYESYGHIFYPTKKSNNPTDSDIGYVFDPLRNKKLQTYFIKAGEGKAQKAINRIAQANKFVEGIPIRLTLRGEHPITEAPSLLAIKEGSNAIGGYIGILKEILLEEFNLDEGEDKLLNDAWLDDILERVEKYILETDTKIVVDGVPKRYTQKDLDLWKQDVPPPLTINTLQKIYNFDKEGNHTGEFYLRVPLSRTEINENGNDVKGQQKIEQYFEHKVSKFVPTQAIVKINNMKEEENLNDESKTESKPLIKPSLGRFAKVSDVVIEKEKQSNSTDIVDNLEDNDEAKKIC